MTNPESERRILELFSGIGGMHSAFTLTSLPGHVVAAIDINTVANAVYAHNHPQTKLLTRNIQKIDAAFVKRMRANTILMSPPCQPFTRTGKQQDVADARSDALVHLCGLITELVDVDAILMENVKGFETSRARDMYLEALRVAGYQYQEFIISPSQLDVPNTRHRYYCLARKWAAFPWQTNAILEQLPTNALTASKPPYGHNIAHHLDSEDNSDNVELLLSADVLLKRGRVLDIADADAERTTCFTKAYTHYTEGTGSVFSPVPRDRVTEVFAAAAGCDNDQALEVLQSLRLRYFSANEVARLMCFTLAGDGKQLDDEVKHKSAGFSFPSETTNRQRYRLLGNSINVYVVSELLHLLFAPIENKVAI